MSQPVYYYKFVPFERKDILKNGLIRFTQIGCFNDPFELEPTITPISREYIEYTSTLSKEEIQAIKPTEDDLNFSMTRWEALDAYKKKYKKEIEKYGVLSLSSNTSIDPLLSVTIPEKKDPRTNILMWSHYADSHKGFVIEFRADFIDGIKIDKVKYTDHRDALTFEDIDNSIFNSIFLKKSIEWEYEQEYRAVLPLEKHAKIHDKDIYLFAIDKSSINSITFGCAMSEENKKTIKDMVENDFQLKGIFFQHAYLNENGYFLDFYDERSDWTNDPIFGCVRIPTQTRR